MSLSRIIRYALGLAQVVLLLVMLLLLVPSAMGQDPTRAVTADDVNAIAKELYCPICESTPLDVCATQACADWREVIRTKLAEGQTAEEIKSYFELQYGARALAEPPRRGFTLAVWILPIAAVVVSAFLFSRYLRAMRAPDAGGRPATHQADGQAATSAADPGPEDEYVARIERELREM